MPASSGYWILVTGNCYRLLTLLCHRQCLVGLYVFDDLPRAGWPLHLDPHPPGRVAQPEMQRPRVKTTRSPIAVVIVRTWLPTMTRAPMPSRLLFVPASRTISHRDAGALSFCHSSAGDPSDTTTMSRRPSPLKSATPQPRCAAIAAASPASAVASRNRPAPSLTKRLFGCWNSSASNSPMRSLTCELAVKMSFQPSLSTSATIEHQPEDFDGQRRESRSLRHLDEVPPSGRLVAEERKRLAGQRREVDVLPAVVVVVLEVDAHAGDRAAGCPAPTRRRASAFSVNVPSPLLRNRKFGTVSLVTKMSMRPSWSKSANATLMPLPMCACRPARADTSSNVPSPRLR